jgi:hypothetical protein
MTFLFREVLLATIDYYYHRYIKYRYISPTHIPWYKMLKIPLLMVLVNKLLTNKTAHSSISEFHEKQLHSTLARVRVNSYFQVRDYAGNVLSDDGLFSKNVLIRRVGEQMQLDVILLLHKMCITFPCIKNDKISAMSTRQ